MCQRYVTLCYYIIDYVLLYVAAGCYVNMLLYVSVMCFHDMFRCFLRFKPDRFYDLISQPFWRHRLAWRLRLAGLEDRIVFLVRHGGDPGQLGRVPCSAVLHGWIANLKIPSERRRTSKNIQQVERSNMKATCSAYSLPPKVWWWFSRVKRVARVLCSAAVRVSRHGA